MLYDLRAREGGRVILSKAQLAAMEHVAVEAEETQNDALKVVDWHSRWSRILSLNAGFE